MGAIADLTASVHGKVEIVWQGRVVPASLKALAAEAHLSGETVRAVLPEEAQEDALDALRREHLHLISVTPVRTSLEDYFVAQLKPVRQTTGATA